MKEIKLIRHGELILQKISDETSFTPELQAKAKKQKDFIASHSETGHHHVIEGDCMVLEEKGKDTFICLSKPSRVIHKKNFDRHDDQKLTSGIWKSYKKKSRDPIAKIVQEVKD